MWVEIRIPQELVLKLAEHSKTLTPPPHPPDK